MFKNRKVGPREIYYFIQGYIRYLIFNSKYKYLIRSHIREQIESRIKSMNKECYNNGTCIECGCMTTHLQMCNKACEGNCYPKMLSKDKWKYMQNNVIAVEEVFWKVIKKTGKFKTLVQG